MGNSLRVGDRCEGKIEKLVFGGSGLCRIKGQVVFVDFAIPDDVVEIEITLTKTDFARGHVVRILKPSPKRVQPKCQYFGRCGGCDWQSLNYEDQLEEKQLMLETLFRTKLGFEGILPIIPSPKPWNYRNRIQLKQTGSAPHFTKKRSHELLAIERCEIAEEEINAKLSQDWTAQARHFPDKVVRVELRAGGSAIVLDAESSEVDETESSSGRFAQVNTEQNEALIRCLLQWSEAHKFTHFYDFYCGEGNLTFPMAVRHEKAFGIGIELSSASIAAANKEMMSRSAMRSRVQFLCGQVESLFRRLSIPSTSLIMLDPPRSGLRKDLAQMLSRTRAQSIFYISCDPVTLVRDLQTLQSEKCWELCKVQPIDMFPQTSHMEVLVELKRAGD